MAPTKRFTVTVLGACAWLAAGGLIAFSTYTVAERARRETLPLHLTIDQPHRLQSGDRVFLTTDAGLVRIGEVAAGGPGRPEVLLAIEPDFFAKLNESTQATYWQTMLTAEEAITTLLPPEVQDRVAETITQAWKDREEEITEAWKPIATDLATVYLEVIGEALEEVMLLHEDDFRELAGIHARSLAEHWPTIQSRLQPILQEHLTPVLVRLLNDAIKKAPKSSIAWSLAMRNNEEALRSTLDFINAYLSNMPEEDRAELNSAASLAWETARNDEVIVDRLSEWGRNLREDQALRDLLAEIYREAVSENPRTVEFLRTEIFESKRIEEEMYRFIDVFAPTARTVAEICLFDEDGVTRPEVVHFVRSVAFDSKVAWVTLTTVDPQRPALKPGATLHAQSQRESP